MSVSFDIQQEGRFLTIRSPLGDGALILAGFSGTEQISRPFSFSLDVVSRNLDIDPQTLLGKAVGWTIAQPDGVARNFHGIVGRLGSGGLVTRGYRAYSLEIYPAFWLLTHTADSRIFQNASVLDILQQILSEYSDIKVDRSGVTSSPPTREYCVQYRETDFAFISRLLEDEGIFYYFEYDEDGHTLVLGDATSAYFECPDKVAGLTSNADVGAGLLSWDRRSQFRTGKWTERDYNFETPNTNLETTVGTTLPVSDFKKYEFFDYPGGYATTSVGNSVTRHRMQEVEAEYVVATGTGTCTGFVPGAKFQVSTHDVVAEQERSWVLTEVSHHATDGSQLPGNSGTTSYTNSFNCIPADVVFRPPRGTPRPVMRGLQTAVVTGPSGEEIYCDKYGRIKVQFPWDRLGKKDDRTTCYIRVTQLLAGPQWGAQFIPRVGMEVLVDFLEGDPDRPIIVGCVYNAVNMPPYALPDQKTQSGLKTRSSKGGSASNCNELRFEDKMGSEQVLFHAEKDFLREVEHDDTLTVGNDQKITIKNDRTETITEGNESVTISQGNRTVTLSQGNDKLTLDQGNRTVTLSQGNDKLTLDQGGRTVTLTQGNDKLSLTQGNLSVEVSLGSSSHEAMQSIELKVGGSSIKIDPTSITLSAMNISVSGQLQTQISGTMTQISGNAMTEISGGLIMIG